MNLDSKRALRRHRLARMKALCLRQVKFRFPRLPEYWREQVNHLYRNRHVCSCDMCCNPRRNGWTKDPRTRQEQASALSAREQINFGGS
jgi:hypothetical protein